MSCDKMLGILSMVALLAAPASAMTLCQKKTGVLALREACKKKEAPVDPATIVGTVQGPQGPEGPQGPQGEPGSAYAWAYVVASGSGFHASGGQVTLSVSKPATGVYCIVIPEKHSGHKAAQVTLADPDGNTIVSVGTGHGSLCNPLVTDTTDVVPVYVVTTADVAVDANFTIVIP
jgi:hypothetical protein